MTSDTTGTRTNSQGEPCPGWCVTDHLKVLYPGGPAADTHISGKLADHGTFGPYIKLVRQDGGKRTEVMASTITGAVHAGGDLAPEDLAQFLEQIAGVDKSVLLQLAGEVRAAAAIIAAAQ